MGDFEGNSAELIRSAAILELGPNATLADARIAYETAKYAYEIAEDKLSEVEKTRLDVLRDAFVKLYQFASTVATRSDETTSLFERDTAQRVLDLSMENMWLVKDGKLVRPNAIAPHTGASRAKPTSNRMQHAPKNISQATDASKDRFTARIKRNHANQNLITLLYELAKGGQDKKLLWLLFGLSAAVTLLVGMLLGFVLQMNNKPGNLEEDSFSTIASEVLVRADEQQFTPSLVQESIRGMESYLNQCTSNLASAVTNSQGDKLQFMLELTISPSGNLLDVAVASQAKLPSELHDCIKHAMLSYFRLPAAPGEKTLLKIPVIVALK